MRPMPSTKAGLANLDDAMRASLPFSSLPHVGRVAFLHRTDMLQAVLQFLLLYGSVPVTCVSSVVCVCDLVFFAGLSTALLALN